MLESVQVDETEALSNAAKNAQRQFREFDEEEVYHTLVDLFHSTRQQQFEHVKKAIFVWESGDVPNIKKNFE